MTVCKVGITGTQQGCTEKQLQVLRGLLTIFGTDAEIYHGDCIGVDEEAHKIALALGCSIIIYPPINPSKRAFCQGATAVREPLPYLNRNKNIILAVNLLIAVPNQPTEVLRSGTWTTVRYGRLHKIPITIIRPNGSTIHDMVTGGG